MDVNELPLVDASSIIDCAAVSARGVLCAKDGLITERASNGDTISEVARSRKDRVKCMVLVSGKELRLWVGMSSGYVNVFAVDHHKEQATSPERVNDSFGACRAEKLAHGGPVSCIISHGRRVYTGSGDKCIFEWHAATMELLRTLPTQRGAVRALAAIGLVLFSSDSTDHSIRCWNLNSCEAAGRLVGHKAVVRSIMYHLLNGTLWTGSEDGNIVVWDVAEQRMLATLTHHTHSVTSLAQTSSGYTVSAGQDSIMCLYTSRSPRNPICVRQVSVPSISSIIPLCEEDESALLWVVRKRLGSKLYELSGNSPASTEIDRSALPPPAQRPKKKASATKRSPSAQGSVRGRSPAPPARRTRGQSPSPAPPSRRPSPASRVARQDSVRSQRREPQNDGLHAALEENKALAEEAKVLRRQLLQTQAEMAKDRKTFEAQLQVVADRESVVTNTLYRATNNIADMLGMVKRLASSHPHIKQDLRELLKCILDTNRTVREMGGDKPKGRAQLSSPLKYGRFPMRSPSPRRGGTRRSPSPYTSPRRRGGGSDVYETRADAASLTSTDGRMPMKRGAWDAPPSRSADGSPAKQGLPVSTHDEVHASHLEDEALRAVEEMQAKELFREDTHGHGYHGHDHNDGHYNQGHNDPQEGSQDDDNATEGQEQGDLHNGLGMINHYEVDPEPEVEPAPEPAPAAADEEADQDPQRLRLASLMQDLDDGDDDTPLVEDDGFLGGLLDRCQDPPKEEQNTLDLSMSVGNEPPPY